MRILGKIAVGMALVTGGLLTLVVLANAWERSHTYYPSPENESAFLRTYALKPVVLPFVDAAGGTDDLSGSGGGAGTITVEHTANFGEYFTMRSERKALLMQAVYNGLERQLRASGMQVLSEYGGVSTGYIFRYRSGNSFGTVSLHALEPGRVQRNLPLAYGLEDVGVRVEIKEEWFPKGISAEVAQALPAPAR